MLAKGLNHTEITVVHGGLHTNFCYAPDSLAESGISYER